MEELVEKVKNGDNNAFTELILQIKKDLYCIAKSRISNDDVIADIIQETMIIAYYNIQKLKNNHLFKTWIIKILINNCNKHYQKKKYKLVSEEEVIVSSSEMDLSNMDFENLIAFLSEEERTILILYYYLGYTTKEISKILGKREGTICSKISRAKVKIKEKYKGEFE